MLRERLADRLPERVDGIRLRGRSEVSRIEGLSDAVFGFAITLLIVSLEVPKTFDQLLAAMSGFIPFALSFWLLSSVWHRQFRWFRAYGLQDDVTAWLNIALLFVVLFYTYPLKFLFWAVLRPEALPAERFWQLWVIYGAGYAAIYTIFTLLYAHALRSAGTLELDAQEQFATRCAVWINVGMVAVGAIVVAIALGGRSAFGAFAGYGFFAIAPMLFALKSNFGRIARLRYASGSG